MSEGLIPRPPLEMQIEVEGGEPIVMTRENTTIVVHSEKQYSDFNHIFIRKLGDYGLRIFGVNNVLPLLLDVGFDVLLKQYPDDVTVATWTDIQSAKLEDEWGDLGDFTQEDE